MDCYLNCTMSCYWHGLSQGTRDLCEEVAPQDRPSHTHTTFILLCLPVRLSGIHSCVNNIIVVNSIHEMLQMQDPPHPVQVYEFT